MEMKTAYQENGDQEALDSAQVLIEEHQGLSLGDKERLLGFLEGGGKMILVEPEYKLAPASKMIGLDGQKMSKSYNNTIALRESPESVEKKLKPCQPIPLALEEMILAIQITVLYGSCIKCIQAMKLKLGLKLDVKKLK